MEIVLALLVGMLSFIAVVVIGLAQRATTYPPSDEEDEAMYEDHPEWFERCKNCKRLIQLYSSKPRKYTCKYCHTVQTL